MFQIVRLEDKHTVKQHSVQQGGITCGAIDEPRKSSKAIDERVIIIFCDKNVVIARFRDKNDGLSYLFLICIYFYICFIHFYTYIYIYIFLYIYILFY